jgi:plastocyanin
VDSRNLFVVVLSGAIALALGCQKHSDAPKAGTEAKPEAKPTAGGAATTTPESEATGAAAAVAKGKGSISGMIKLQGTVQPTPVDLGDKVECKKLHGDTPPMSDSLVAGPEGGLRDVVVYVSKGGGRHKPPAEPAVIDQKKCVYTPHVFVIQKGQNLEIRSSDDFLHNVNCQEGGFNESMNKIGSTVKKAPFQKLGPATFQCSVHTFMRAFTYVVDNPYHAVTNEKGEFKLDGVPEGKYTLSVWHERVPGLKAPAPESLEVEVKADQDTKAEFAAFVYDKK